MTDSSVASGSRSEFNPVIEDREVPEDLPTLFPGYAHTVIAPGTIS